MRPRRPLKMKFAQLDLMNSGSRAEWCGLYCLYAKHESSCADREMCQLGLRDMECMERLTSLFHWLANAPPMTALSVVELPSGHWPATMDPIYVNHTINLTV
jgi:hypothetical protein